MKKLNLALVLVGIVTFSILARADILATGSYEGNGDPQYATPSWTILANAGTHYNAAGIFTISTPDDGSGYRVADMKDTTSLNFGGTWTVDVRFKLASTSTIDYSFVTTVAASHSGWFEHNEVYIANDGWSGNHYSHVKSSYPNEITLGTNWHVLRLSRTFIDDGHAHPAKVYLDNMYLGDCSWTTNIGSAEDHMRIGDDTGRVGGTVDYDYVRWVNGTAYDVDPASNPMVIPEPATIGVLAIGALGFIRRRSRK